MQVQVGGVEAGKDPGAVEAQVTRVVHVRSVDLRDAGVVYIGRVGRGQDGYFGNPVAKGRRCPVCGGMHSSPGATLPCYRDHLAKRLREDAEFQARVRGLRGRVLACFCKPGPCHGDALAAAA